MSDSYVDTMVDLIRWFEANPQWVCCQEIAQSLGVSERTAQRYIARVDRWVPLEERKMGCRFEYRRMASMRRMA